MKKTMKTLASLLIVVVVLATTMLPAFAKATIPEATTDFYVNDFANVFTEEQKSTLMANAVTLANENNGVQVVITTVKSLEGEPAADYAYEMYNKYGIGKDDMGLLILLATEDREIRVEVGKAMEGYISDSKAGRFIDKYAISYLAENKFAEGLISLQTAFVEEIKTQIASEKDGAATPKADKKIDFTPFLWVVAIVLCAGITVFFVIYIIKKIKEEKEYVEELKTNLCNAEDMLDKTNEQYKSEKRSLQSKLDFSESENEQLKEQLKEAREKHERVLKIYPDADRRVQEMIRAEEIEQDKRAAKAVDDMISKVVDLSPSKDLIDDFKAVISAYDDLTIEQEDYVTGDISSVKEKYRKSVELWTEHQRKLELEREARLREERKERASSVTKQILAIIAGISIARACHVSVLKNAMGLYDGLDYETQKFVDHSVIDKLKTLLSDAQRDEEEEEAAERRRRHNSYSSTPSFGGYRGSSSSFGGRSSFGGFGGRSGGGGAGRRF